MIQTVLKRDGRVVGFNEEKIATAIRKAMLHTDKGEDLQLIHQITDRISFKGDSQMTVEAIQDLVEVELMKSSRKDVAQNTSPTATSEALPARQRRATCSWRLSTSSPTTSHAKMPI